jgi:membrane-associated PAP2 superfamily phosphatase
MTSHFKIPVALYLVLLICFLSLGVIYYFKLDFYFADMIYSEHQSWFYKNHWFANTVMHSYTKKLIILAFVIYIIKTVISHSRQSPSTNIYPKLVLIISVLLGTLVVSALKVLLESDCPWDLIRYGGDKQFFSIFDYDAAALPSNKCFPAAHASMGFTFISIYFYCVLYLKRYKYHALIASLFLGFTLGFFQQLRGAHFISHDIWSLIVCISVNIVIYSIAFNSWFLNLVKKNV